MSSAPLESLSNPLATPDQLLRSSSSLDNVSPELEASIRYAGVRLTQAAGVLLRLPQDVIAQAIVVFLRFWLGPEGGSMMTFATKDISAAALYLMAKMSAYPVAARSVLTVYAFLLSREASPLDFVNLAGSDAAVAYPDPRSYHLSEGTYQAQRLVLMKTETMVLRICGFNVHVNLPHSLALTYLRTLGVSSLGVSRRVVEHLNTALFSPQMVYLTHQPNALAVAAIYLAAREKGVKMVGGEWWETLDVDREELGFLVVAIQSTKAFAEKEQAEWRGKAVPLVALNDLAREGGG